jgi:hypothetical protein
MANGADERSNVGASPTEQQVDTSPEPSKGASQGPLSDDTALPSASDEPDVNMPRTPDPAGPAD